MSTGLADKTYRYLQEKLTGGYLAPGKRLVDRVVADELGISPTPVRAAFNRLISEGALQHVPSVGVFVPTTGRREIEDIYEFREILECATVEKVCGKLSETTIAEMEACLTEQAQILDQLQGDSNSFQAPAFAERWRRSDECFHAAFLRAAGNRYVMQTINRLRTQVQLVYRTSFSWKETYVAHRQFLAALRRGDTEEAKRILSAHICKGCESALKACDEQYMGDPGIQHSIPQSFRGAIDQGVVAEDKQSVRADTASLLDEDMRQKSSGRRRTGGKRAGRQSQSTQR